MTTPIDHRPDTIALRYSATLAAQGIRLLLSFVTAVIVPRALGPVAYGNYSYLLSTATTLRTTADMGTQQAFFTFSSQQDASGPLTRLYACALALQAGVVFIFILVAATLGETTWLWPAQSVPHILWVTLLEWAIFLALSLQQLGDSKGLTARAQLIGALVALLTMAALLALWLGGALDFDSYVRVSLAGNLVTVGVLAHWLLVRNGALLWSGTLAVGGYVARWWRFARPLLLLQYYLPLAAFAGLWLLQHWYGSAEQGYYALALQWSSLAMVFTNAAVNLFWREIANHHAGGRRAELAATYQKFSRMLFLLAIVLSCGLAAAAGTLVELAAGPKFAAAALVVAIMAFYPLAQTVGQLTAAAMKASERTGQFARLSLWLSVPDLVLCYFLLAPGSAPVPGLGLGAVGMALRTAIFGLVSVHAFDWLNRRELSLEFAATLAQRVVALIVVGALAFATLHAGGTWLERLGVAPLAALVVAGTAYLGCIAALIWMRPGLAGLTHGEITQGARSFFRRTA